MKPKRVVSLLPAATEIVCALGARAQLVGRSHECDSPAEIRDLPACTALRVGADGPSGEIDREVKARLQEGAPLYRLETERLKELRPDVIITQAQCEVCAVSLSDVEALARDWPGRPPEVVSLAPARLADIWADIQRVADALDIAEHGKEVARALKNRVVNIVEKTCLLKERSTVLCVEWIEPLMAAGNWVPELVGLAGGVNVAGEAGKHSPWLDWETLVRLDPEVIVVMPCGFDLKRTRTESAALARHPAWSKLRAVKEGRSVFATDGNQYFNRPGPRVVESLEILAEILHDDRFNFGHQGTGWEGS